VHGRNVVSLSRPHFYLPLPNVGGEMMRPQQILVNQRGKVINLLATENLPLLKELVADLAKRRKKHMPGKKPGQAWGIGKENSKKIGSAKGHWRKKYGLDLMDTFETLKRAYRPQSMKLIPLRTEDEDLSLSAIVDIEFVVKDADLGTITSFDKEDDEVTLEEIQQTLDLLESTL
jgi:hypothetical protein